MADSEIENKKATELSEKDSIPLMTVTTIFPFTLIPDTVEVYRSKVLIIRRALPFIRNEFPVLLEDMKTVQAGAGIIFGSLRFELSGFETNPAPIEYLTRADAFEIRRLIMGLAFLSKKKVSLSELDRELLIEKALKAG